MQITRRHALLGATAVATTAAIPAAATLAKHPADDTTLFEAIGRWRAAHDTYELEHDRQSAILDRVDAEMPRHEAVFKAHYDALYAAPYRYRIPNSKYRNGGACKSLRSTKPCGQAGHVLGPNPHAPKSGL